MSAEHSHDAHDDGNVHVHISSTPFYIGIFGALILLTFATVKVSYYDFGSANIIIAMLIATMKASLVAAFFMHLRYDQLFNTLAFLAAFLFLGIFILLTYDDMGKRGRIDNAYGTHVFAPTGVAAAGGEPSTTATDEAVEHEAPGAPGGEHGDKGGKNEKKE
jgi:cytochrome c oxidase subunit IV